MNINPAVLQDLTAQLAACPDVQKIVLFGSRARGDAKERSDFDIAVFGVNDFGIWTQLFQIAEEAATLLKIDMMRFELLDVFMQTSILREGKVLYERSSY